MSRLGDNFLNQLVGTTKPELIISSNITPDITIDLSKFLSTSGAPPAQAVSGSNKLTLQLIQPEITFQSLGMQKTVAPYGKPVANMYLAILVSLVACAFAGALVTWKLCELTS